MKALLGVYSLREAMAKDLEGTLAQAKKLGFDGIELAWYAGHSVEAVREAVKKLDLQVWSCHTDVKEMLADPHKNFSDIVSLWRSMSSSAICGMTSVPAARILHRPLPTCRCWKSWRGSSTA